MAVIEGDDGNDALRGGGGADLIYGHGGDDRLWSGASAGDGLYGGDGDDELIFLGRNGWAVTGGGVNSVRGSGSTQLNYLDWTGPVRLDFAAGTASGRGFRDHFTGVDSVRGSGFDDRLMGRDDAGWEGFHPEAGDDLVDGRGGFDVVIYSLETGGRGVRLDFAAGRARDTYGDTDTLRNVEGAQGTARKDALKGSDAPYETFQGLEGADRIAGRRGFDRADHSADADHGGGAGIRADLAKGRIRDGFGDRDDVTSVEMVLGTAKRDVIYGDGARWNRLDGKGGDDRLVGRNGQDDLFGGYGDDVLDGGRGDDRLFAHAGDDLLRGGAGADLLKGGRGDDVLRGGRGDDVLAGGPGADTFVFSRGAGTDRVRDFEPGRDTLDLRAFDLTPLTPVETEALKGALLIVLGRAAGIRLDGVAEADLSAADFLLHG